jgi:hypothetical protein
MGLLGWRRKRSIHARIVRSTAPFLIIALALTVSDAAKAATILVTVEGDAGPWDPSINPAYSYGVGQTAPTSLSVLPGSEYIIAYASGLWSTSPPGFNDVDANGFCCRHAAGGHGLAPGFYIPGPPFLQELIGTFANSSGVIVGNPFAIGNGPLSFSAPLGSSMLLLGTNDSSYFDNSGAILVSVTGDFGAVPIPAALPLFATGLGLMGLLGWRRRRKATSAPSAQLRDFGQ